MAGFRLYHTALKSILASYERWKQSSIWMVIFCLFVWFLCIYFSCYSIRLFISQFFYATSQAKQFVFITHRVTFSSIMRARYMCIVLWKFLEKAILQKYKTFLAFLLFIANEMDVISLVLLQKQFRFSINEWWIYFLFQMQS